MEGNERYVAGEGQAPDRSTAAFAATASAQRPLAIVLSCSDSRVAPELFLDQGVGDLFVVRVAGNVLTPDGQASMEYAVAVLEAPLLLVLGHENCGAVSAAIQSYEQNATFPGTIGNLVAKIEPAVAIASADEQSVTLPVAIRANVRYCMAESALAGTVLSKAIAEKRLTVAGGVYDVKTGRVTLVE